MPSITNIGLRPTFGDVDRLMVETHVFDIDRDLYGADAAAVVRPAAAGRARVPGRRRAARADRGRLPERAPAVRPHFAVESGYVRIERGAGRVDAGPAASPFPPGPSISAIVTELAAKVAAYLGDTRPGRPAAAADGARGSVARADVVGRRRSRRARRHRSSSARPTDALLIERALRRADRPSARLSADRRRDRRADLAALTARPPRFAMRLYNTLTRREEDFAPSRDNTVRMYTCGLTVYARGHIGNFRTFVAVDVLRRALKYQEGFDVRQVMNFTDVDDRTILESKKAGVPLREYTDRFIAAFREDAAALGLEPVEEQPRATDDENIAAMAETIKALEQNGHTYTSDGSIYFKISTFPEYGKLARLDHAGIKSGARVDSRQVREGGRPRLRAVEGDASRASRRGSRRSAPGRPGWHIECSAMALRLLGESPIDIHAGGVDLIFPHHENEIAQSEGATGQQFSRFWVHVEHLMIEEDDRAAPRRCRSRSATSTTSQDIVEQGFRPSALRYLYLGVHYRKQLKFSWTRDGAGRGALKRLTDFLARLDTLPAGAAHDADRGAARARRATAFRAHIRADLNTAAALGVMFDLVRALNSSIDAGELSAGDAPAVRAHVRRVRSRARRPVAAARRGRAAAGAGRGDRAADPGAPRRARSRATSPKPIGSARTSTPAASCSRTPARDEVEEEVEPTDTRLDARSLDHMNAPDIKTAAARPEGQGDHRARREVRVAVLHARLSVRDRARRRARSSRTSTATASSTAPPASP